jgi:hypothetical protein
VDTLNPMVQNIWISIFTRKTPNIKPWLLGIPEYWQGGAWEVWKPTYEEEGYIDHPYTNCNRYDDRFSVPDGNAGDKHERSSEP